MVQTVLNQIRAELRRLNATEIRATLDEAFEPTAGVLIKVELKGAYWHLLPAHLLELLKELSNSAGSEAVRCAIEKSGVFVWHGPSPSGSRDTSP